MNQSNFCLNCWVELFRNKIDVLNKHDWTQRLAKFYKSFEKNKFHYMTGWIIYSRNYHNNAFLTHFTPILSFYFPERWENLWSPDVFRGYRKELLAWSGLSHWTHNVVSTSVKTSIRSCRRLIAIYTLELNFLTLTPLSHSKKKSEPTSFYTNLQ